MDIGATIISLEKADLFSAITADIKADRESQAWKDVELDEKDVKYIKKMQHITASASLQLPLG